MSKYCLLGCVTAVGLALPPSVCAGEPTSAKEVVAKYIEAIGGRAAIDAIKTVRMTGKMLNSMGMEMPLKVEFERPNRMRVEFSFQGMTGTRAVDGDTGWSIMPFMGKTDPEKMSAEDVEDLKDQADMDGPLIDYEKKGHKLELIGKEEEDGSEVYKLKLTKKNGNVHYYYLDAEYFIPLKQTAKRTFQGTEIEIKVMYGDYKEVAGKLFPHSISQGTGMGSSTMTMETIEANVRFPEDHFKMPEVKKAEVAVEKVVEPEAKKPTPSDKG